MKKLKFGDEKSIAYRDNQTIENIWERLKKKVVCPACKGKADSYFEWSIEEEWIGINFYCKSSCPNSIENIDCHSGYEPSIYFDFNGKKANK